MAIEKKTKKTYQSTVKAGMKWRKEHIKQIKLDFNIESDMDILAKLASVPNRTEYIRNLIREDMKK